MSEAEIRKALADAETELDDTLEKTGMSRGKKVLAAVAMTVGLGMVSACYGAPPPRPPSNASDAVYKMQRPPVSTPAKQATVTAEDAEE
jgi:hypothetical protein